MRSWLAIVALVGLASIVGGCSDDDEAAFSFANDDLCEWVTGAEVATFVAEVFDWDGTAVEVEPGRHEEVACEWVLTGAGADTGLVVASDAGEWRDFDGNPIDIGESEVVDFVRRGAVEIGASVVGHPAVTEGVVVTNGGFGQFAFWVPSSDEYLSLGLQVPGEDVFEDDRLFAVADHFVTELGWLPQQ